MQITRNTLMDASEEKQLFGFLDMENEDYKIHAAYTGSYREDAAAHRIDPHKISINVKTVPYRGVPMLKISPHCKMYAWIGLDDCVSVPANPEKVEDFLSKIEDRMHRALKAAEEAKSILDQYFTNLYTPEDRPAALPEKVL